MTGVLAVVLAETVEGNLRPSQTFVGFAHSVRPPTLLAVREAAFFGALSSGNSGSGRARTRSPRQQGEFPANDFEEAWPCG